MSEDHRDAETFRRQIEALEIALGADIIDALDRPDVNEIDINSDGIAWINEFGQPVRRLSNVVPAVAIETALRTIATLNSRAIDEQHPRLQAVLPGRRCRIQGFLPPVTRGPAIAIRKRAERIFTLADYVSAEIMTQSQADVTAGIFADRGNIIIAGGTRTGKTTLANAYLAMPELAGDRIVIIQDQDELQCSAPNTEYLFTSVDPVVTQQDLVRDSLRCNPDRLFLGECRGGEMYDCLKAWNTGHPGGLATLHSDSERETPWRIEELCAEAIQTVSRRQIARTISAIIYLRRTSQGLRVSAVGNNLHFSENEWHLNIVDA